jgi:large repetitive protein
MRNSIGLKPGQIQIILSALFGLFLLPIQANSAVAAIGDIYSQATASFSVNENIDTTTVTIDPADSATVTGTPTYTLSGSDASSFTVNPSTGVLSFVNSPDFELDPSYTVDVVADDGSTTDTLTVSVSILNVGPTWSQATASFSVNENIDTTTVTIDPADSATVTGTPTYTLSGSDASSFTVNPSTGVLSFVNSPDFELDPSYTVDVVATENDETETLSVTIQVSDLLWSDVSQSFSSIENIADTTTVVVSDSATAVGATGYSLGGTDAASFTLDSTSGDVYFLSSPDYETKSSYTYELGATDGTVWETATITVSITNDASDDPTPAPAPTPVYIPTTPQAALVLTSSAASVAWGSSVKLTLAGGSGTGAVTYSSTGTTFCAVNPSGNLTPVSAGTCTVTANKDGDGTYGSAQSNSITITATENAVASTSSTSNSGVAMVVGKPVGGVATVKFTVADTYAGEKVSVILATKSSSGKTLYKTLGSAKVGTTGAVSFKTKVKLPVGAVLQLKSAGTVILSKSIK